MSASSLHPDVLIAGAGIIGLSLALELHARHATVAVIDPQLALRQTTWAAAGMLAADDPHNPAALHPLASFSVALYPAYLRRIEAITGIAVPFQTDTVVQYLPGGATQRFPEHSVDPRQLAEALLIAVRSTPITLYENTGRWDFADLDDTLHIRTASGVHLFPRQLIHATGAWFQGRQIVTPRKGQMLRVAMPPGLDLREVHRRADIYIVPRTAGPQAGSAVIGATDEDAGYDLRTHTLDLDRLRSLAAELLPDFASADDAPAVESWAGLRPSTPDLLPLLGALSQRQFVATGHYRNGILLAPATAVVIADLITGNSSPIDLSPFNPQRFQP
jgi:glycine oxidase